MADLSTNTSPKYRLNWKDAAKGGIISVSTSVVVVIQTSIQAGSFHVDPKAVALAASSSALAYLLKNFLQGPSGQA